MLAEMQGIIEDSVVDPMCGIGTTLVGASIGSIQPTTSSSARALGEGPLIRRPTEEWIEAECRHPALIPDDWFARAQADMSSRRTKQSNPRRRSQQRFYLLRGIVRCATGHNALRMQGKTRKGNIYYACGYRSAHGDKAAEALGHGKWQYIREDRLTDLIDRFFGTYVFGPNAVAHFRSRHTALAPALNDPSTGRRERLTRRLADLDQRNSSPCAPKQRGWRR
jgi:hypothetical protein